ncbi:hypothetical protein FRC09_001201 [Ceratobasidium sp. 395]|nr:hypothetical protein FRC09_001201 [Ceratobasidium sp. 395]
MSLRSGSSINPSLAWSMGNAGKGRFHMTFPLTLAWYHEQPCTRFQSLQHRKEREGLQHEFIVLELTDGSICRVERMGDPNARFEAISATGTVAYDMAQSFSPDRLSGAHLDTSDLVARVTLPAVFDLMDVLRICRAIHEGEKTDKYTLQKFNCYFFALAIQAVLTGLVRDWKGGLTNPDKRRLRALYTPSSLYKSPSPSTQQPFVFRIYSLLEPDTCWPVESLLLKLEQELCSQKLTEKADEALGAVLWHSDLGLAIDHVWCRQVRDLTASMLLHAGDEHTAPSSFAGSSGDLRQLLLSLISQAISTHEEEFQTLKMCQLRLSVGLFQELYKPLLQDLLLLTIMESLDFRRIGVPQPPSIERPPPPRLSPELSQQQQRTAKSTALSLLQDLTLRDWITCAIYMVALWVLQNFLVLLNIPVHLEQPQHDVIVEDELSSVLDAFQLPGYTNEVASTDAMIQKLDFLVHAPSRVVRWKEWPWDHIYQPIKKSVLDSIFEKEKECLGITFRNSAGEQVMSVSRFQDCLLDRIRDHSKRVESYWLGNASEIQTELKEKLSQVWALMRSDKEASVNGIMAVPNIIVKYLDGLGCKNLADQVDFSFLSGQLPVSSGGFGDLYRAKLLDGSQVAIRTLRLYYGSTQDHIKKSHKPTRHLRGHVVSILTFYHYLDWSGCPGANSEQYYPGWSMEVYLATLNAVVPA